MTCGLVCTITLNGTHRKSQATSILSPLWDVRVDVWSALFAFDVRHAVRFADRPRFELRAAPPGLVAPHAGQRQACSERSGAVSGAEWCGRRSPNPVVDRDRGSALR